METDKLEWVSVGLSQVSFSKGIIFTEYCHGRAKGEIGNGLKTSDIIDHVIDLEIPIAKS